jgi:plasmid stabilization system protein ParE
MTFVWSPAAFADLEDIRDHIRLDTPERAISLAREITGVGEAVGAMPRAIPLLARLEHKGVHRR